MHETTRGLSRFSRSENGAVPFRNAQNVATGELAYKPVLKTTLRPPVALLDLVFAGAHLQCSGGHPFWVIGKGWTKARQLSEGCHLHAVNGSVPLRSIRTTGEAQLHNLIVADFHTYFVTDAKLLTHDNTIRHPTTAPVPGLSTLNPEP